jgi:integrase
MESFSPRDLRRTFKTLGGSIGISLELRNRLQGHAMTDIGSMHYDRWSYLPEKRLAMEQWIEFLRLTVTDGES